MQQEQAMQEAQQALDLGLTHLCHDAGDVLVKGQIEVLDTKSLSGMIEALKRLSNRLDVLASGGVNFTDHAAEKVETALQELSSLAK